MTPPDRDALRRVVVVGVSGAGKTTFARALAARLGQPHVELDALFHLPGWQPRPMPSFRALVAGAVAAPRWVVDGNYRSARDLVWPRATCLIWLNYAFPRVFGRLFGRTVRRVVTGEVLFGGNREHFRQAFLSHDSILLYLCRSYPVRRRAYRAVFDAKAGPARVEFRHPREADRFLAALPPEG